MPFICQFHGQSDDSVVDLIGFGDALFSDKPIFEVFTHHVVCCNGVCSQLKLYSCTSYNSLRDSGIQLLAPELPATKDGL